MIPYDSQGSGAPTMPFDRMYPVFARLRADAPRLVHEMERMLELGRDLRREVIGPRALAVDRAATRDPTYVAEEVLREAARRRFFGAMIPRLLGGGGVPFGAVMMAIEEISAGCLGLANLCGVHGLALSTIAATGDLAAMERVARTFVRAEKAGRPHLLSTAITEPGAGTDVEDVDLLRHAKLGCEATPVRGGFRLRGRKVFISNGSIAQTHVVVMPTDRCRPVETTYAFLVETGSPGFSIGRVERKMGQKACPAAELVFDDCFVPETDRIGGSPLPGRKIDLVLGATRGGVACFGAGVARGAYERTLHYAHTHKLGGRWLVDCQWVQIKLAEMLRNVMVARAAYVEAMIANELFGLSSIAGGSAGPGMLPDAWLERVPVERLVSLPFVQARSRRAIEQMPEADVGTASAFGAAAKVTATDLAMVNCHLAMDVAGADGLRHDHGIEKLFRDAKLLQIYEGTNQLNRLDLFKRHVDGTASIVSPAARGTAPATGAIGGVR